MLDSLRSRLVLSNLLISLLGLSILAVVFTFALGNRMTDVKQKDRQEQARDTAAEVSRIYHLPPTQSKEQLRQLVFTASEVLHARLVVVSPLGHLVVDSAWKTPFYKGSWKLLDESALRAEKNTELAIQSSRLVRFQAPIRGVHRPNGGAVLLVVPSPEVRPSGGELASIILFSMGAAVLIWVLIGLYFTSSISRPLLRITEATEEMARGNYGARVNIRGQGEIARLGTSFNTMAEQVQRSSQVMKDFVANVSHDLRTPLTMISGYSQALLDGTARQDEIEESAEVIHEEAGKMQRLVEDLLQLIRLESGLLRLDRRPTALFPLVDRHMDRASRTAGSGRLPELRNLVPPDLAPVDIDPVRVERAIRNLLDNAIRHTPSEGSVTVSASLQRRGWVEMTVSDTGSGIPPDDLPRIFERFYRSDKSRERGEGHYGLGLSIVRQIIEAHGGRIWVESRLGAGTTFHLELPEAVRIAAPDEERRGVAAL